MFVSLWKQVLGDAGMARSLGDIHGKKMNKCLHNSDDVVFGKNSGVRRSIVHF